MTLRTIPDDGTLPNPKDELAKLISDAIKEHIKKQIRMLKHLPLYRKRIMGEAILGTEAQSLTSLVDYQTGSVVSRTLLSKSVGNVTVFAFDENQGLSEHTTPYDAMVLVAEGELEIKIEGKPQKLIGGEVLTMPANKPHSVFSTGRSKMLLIMVHE